jgi:imidazoleglycerol-phosphate dehydratase
MGKGAIRSGLEERITPETNVQVALSLDGGDLDLLPENAVFASLPSQSTSHHASHDSPSQHIWIWTGIEVLDHLIYTLARYSGWSLRVRTLLTGEREHKKFDYPICLP